MNRRDFLYTAGLGLAVAASPLATAASGAGMRLGFVTYLWGKDMDLPTLLSACEKSGLLGLEVRTGHKHGIEPSLTKAQRQEVRKRFAASPVELVGYGSNCEFHSPDPARVKQNVELAKQYIQLMHDCGGAGVKVKPNDLPAGVPREKTIEQIGEALNELGAYAADYGQKLRVEVHGRATSEVPVMKQIFDVATHPNVYVCWNCNAEDLKGAGLEANFDMLKGRFGDTAHIRELNVAEYPYAKLMDLFKRMRYRGWLLLEARTDPQDKVQAMREQLKLFEQMVKT